MSTDHPASSMAKLLFSAWKRRNGAAILIIESVAVILGCSSPLVQRNLIDAVNGGNRAETAIAVLLLGCIVCSGFAGRSIGRWLRGRLAIRLKGDLKTSMFRHLMALPEEFLHSRGGGYFFNRIQNDANETAAFMSGGGLTFWTDVLKLLLAFAVIAFLQWRIALLTMPFLLSQWLVCFIFRRRQYRLSHRIQECTASERNTMLDFFNHHTTLKTHAAADLASERIDSGISRWRKLMLQRLGNENCFVLWLQLPVWICCGGVVVFGLNEVLLHHWSLGELWAVTGLLTMAFAPARSLGGGFFQMQSALAAWTRLLELQSIDTESAMSEPSSFSLTGDIVISGVTFRYGLEAPVLGNLTYTIPGGSLSFITGNNGTGKSTLLSLLLRLYNPQSGTITIGGKNIADFDLNTYRSRIGYLGQRPEFFKGTLRDNLRMNGNCSDDEIRAMLQRLGCEHLIEDRTGGLSSSVAERGDNFSGGERLRLALARELLRDTDILLCDEPAANLDAEGRRRFYKLLEDFAGNKTVIVVVHDLPEHWHGSVTHLSPH